VPPLPPSPSGKHPAASAEHFDSMGETLVGQPVDRMEQTLVTEPLDPDAVDRMGETVIGQPAPPVDRTGETVIGEPVDRMGETLVGDVPILPPPPSDVVSARSSTIIDEQTLIAPAPGLPRSRLDDTLSEEDNRKLFNTQELSSQELRDAQLPGQPAFSSDEDPFQSMGGPVWTPAQPVDDDALVGEVLDERYKIVACVGRGATGVVYRAQHLLLNRDVAIKLLNGIVTPESVARHEREARALAQFEHPSVVRILAAGNWQSKLYLALEFVEGRPLNEVMEQEGPLPLARVNRILSQILEGLAEGHAQGIVHRDLKAENLLLTGEGDDEQVKILDFGVAKLLAPEDEDPQSASNAFVTTERVALGTPEYMSPEQASGSAAVDARSDLYSLGVVTYEMLTGKLPFESETPVGFISKHLLEPPRSFAKVAPQLKVQPQVERFVLRALEKEPDDRYQTAAEMLVSMERLLGARRRGSAKDKAAVTGSLSLPGAARAAHRAGLGHRQLLGLLKVLVIVASVLLLGIVLALWLRGSSPDLAQMLEAERPTITAALAGADFAAAREAVEALSAGQDPEAVAAQLTPELERIDALSATHADYTTHTARFAGAHADLQTFLQAEDADPEQARSKFEALESSAKQLKDKREALTEGGVELEDLPAVDWERLRAQLAQLVEGDAQRRLLAAIEEALQASPPRLDEAEAALEEARKLRVSDARLGRLKERLGLVRERVAIEGALAEDEPDLPALWTRLTAMPDEQPTQALRDRVHELQSSATETALEEIEEAVGGQRYVEALEALEAERDALAEVGLADRWDLAERESRVAAERDAWDAYQLLPESGDDLDSLNAARAAREDFLQDYRHFTEKVRAELEAIEAKLEALEPEAPGDTEDPTQPGDTDPGDTEDPTDPGDTDPGDTDPSDTDPSDTEDPTQPGDTDPGDTEDPTQPSDTNPEDVDTSEIGGPPVGELTEDVGLQLAIDEARRALARDDVTSARAALSPFAKQDMTPAAKAEVGRLIDLAKRRESLQRFLAARCTRIGELYVSVTEIRNSDYVRFCKDNLEAAEASGDAAAIKRAQRCYPISWRVPGKPKPHWDVPEGEGKLPATYVSFEAAQAYCAWLSEKLGAKVRLPTEAEWIAAAIEGRREEGPYEWGKWNPRRAVWAFLEGPQELEAPRKVDEIPLDLGLNPAGLIHMTGNVTEWVDTAPPGRPNYRVLKGGSYRTERGKEQLRLDYVFRGRPDERQRDWGFRVVVEWR